MTTPHGQIQKEGVEKKARLLKWLLEKELNIFSFDIEFLQE